MRQVWNARYRENDRLWIGEPDPAIVGIVERVQPRSAVDLGAGEGRNALWLASRGIETTAVDVADVALERLARAAEEQGLAVTIQHATIEEFAQLGLQFDLVLLANIHPPAEERRRLHALAFGLASPGGRLVIIGHHVDGVGIAGPPDPDRLLSEDEIRSQFPERSIELLEVVRDRADHGHVAPSLVAVVRRDAER